jgi:hypothetical protein
VVQRFVQFKAGVLRQHDYVVGDRLELNDEAQESMTHVLVDGAPEGCPVCGFERASEEIFAVEIKNGVIVAVGPASPDVAPTLLAAGVVTIE